MTIFNFPNFYSHSSYSIGERVLRTTVFQIGVAKGVIERILMWFYFAFVQRTCFPEAFNLERAEKSLNSLINLGGQIEFIEPKDRKAKIQVMHLQSADLEAKLHALGASWEKIMIIEEGESKSVLVIIPPQELTEEWHLFEKDLLRLKWNKRNITIKESEETQEVIVTCENAESIGEEDWHRNLFLHVNSASVSFVMLTRRIGFYLGCKQNICFYDPRGTWKSSGIPSEAGYYNDVSAVFEKRKGKYEPENIWVSSACAGSGANGYLKSLTHGTGVNFMFENGYSNFKRDFVDEESWIVKTFAECFWDGLASKDIAPQDKPRETSFNLFELWEDLELTDIGKVMIVSVTNDQRLSPGVARRNVELAHRINQNVRHISFESELKEDPHFDRYFNYSDARAQVLAFIFDQQQNEEDSIKEKEP
jgi:hypothetical protein